MNGKIIVITGGPRTGKSTLVKMLAEKLEGKMFLEGEEKDIPKRVWEDIETGNRVLEMLLWFRNKLVKDYLGAMKIKEAGGIAVLDTFWATNDVYIGEWVTDAFEQGILKDLMQMDYETLPWPDLIISLYSSEEKIKEFAIAGGREFELKGDFLQKQVDLNNTHEKYFRALAKPNIHFISRADFNYFNEEQFAKFVAEVKDWATL